MIQLQIKPLSVNQCWQGDILKAIYLASRKAPSL